MIALALLAILVLCLQAAEAQMLRGEVSFSRIKGMIGARIGKTGIVSAVRYRSPAQLAGLKTGDKIIGVNFESFALSKIHGSAGERITLTVMRPGENPRNVEISFDDYRAIDYKTNPQSYYDELGSMPEFGETL